METYALMEDEPPCSDCQKPEDLSQENLSIIKLWARCNNFEREYSDMSGSPKRLKTADLLPVCELHDRSRDDLEKVLLVESVVYPFICATAKQRQEQK